MSRFESLLGAGGFPVSLEITPPKSRRNDVLLRRARILGNLAAAVNVIQRPDRLASLDASLLLLEQGLEPVWHLVNRGRTRQDVDAEISVAAAGRIPAVLCIRGDHSATDSAETPTIHETIERVKQAMPEALIGATMNQYVDHRRVLANLWPKLEAGAGFVQTQPVFDLEQMRPLAEAVRSRSPGTWIVPLVMPLLSRPVAERIQDRLQISIPSGLVSALDRGGAPAGWEAFAAILRSLREGGLADGVAIMTPEMDPAADVIRGLAEAIGP